jgi:excisionase family DNA binding protein
LQLKTETPVLSIPQRIAAFGKAMTAEQLDDVLSISAITIYKHAKAGKIPSFRVGTCVRFCPKEICDWMATR